jgi:hypothetical protein
MKRKQGIQISLQLSLGRCQSVANLVLARQPSFLSPYLRSQLLAERGQELLPTGAVDTQSRICVACENLGAEKRTPLFVTRQVLSDEDVCLEPGERGCERLRYGNPIAGVTDGPELVADMVANETNDPQWSTAPEVQRQDGHELTGTRAAGGG